MPKGDRLRLKADPEDGTTPIANLLLDAVAIAKLSGLHKGAILHLWRVTYGWTDDDGRRRKEAKISLSEWAKALDTDNTRSSKTLAELVEKNIVSRRVTDAWGGYYYRLNTDIASWNSGSINHTKLREIIGIPDFSSVGENATVGETTTVADLPIVDQSANTTVGENATQQLAKTQLPTLYKENKKKLKEGNGFPLIPEDTTELVDQIDDHHITVNTERGQSTRWVFAQLDEARGHRPSVKRKAEAASIMRMLKSYTKEEIILTYKEMKVDKFWATKVLYMTSVESQIGAYRVERFNGNGAHRSNSQTSGQSAGDSPETSKFISGKYGHMVEH